MSRFCTSCGAPLSGAFCTRCGQRAQAQPQPSSIASDQPQPPAPAQTAPLEQPQPTVTQPATAPQPSAAPPQPAVPPQSAPAASTQPVTAAGKSSGLGKALLIAGGVILVLCIAAFAAAIYGVHWVKGKVSSITGGTIGGSGQVQVSNGHACDLLSTADLQQVLGVTVERSSEIMEGNEPGCAYFTNPAAFAELQKIAMEQARRDSEKASKDPALNNSKNDNPLALLGHTEEMEGMVKGLGLSQPDKDGKVFSFTVDRNFGSGNWGTLRTTISIVPGFKEIDGVGDHAMLGSFGHAFYVLKGGSMFHLDTMYVPETRLRGAELARKLVSH